MGTALIDVRVLPWCLKPRVMKASSLRDGLANLDGGASLIDDPGALIVGIATALFIFIAAPLIVLVLAALLFSVELPIVIALALLLVVIRFAGIVPWTVVVIDSVTGAETRENYRNIVRAVRRVRAINAGRRVSVRWSWT